MADKDAELTGLLSRARGDAPASPADFLPAAADAAPREAEPLGRQGSAYAASTQPITDASLEQIQDDARRQMEVEGTPSALIDAKVRALRDRFSVVGRDITPEAAEDILRAYVAPDSVGKIVGRTFHGAIPVPLADPSATDRDEAWRQSARAASAGLSLASVTDASRMSPEEAKAAGVDVPWANRIGSLQMALAHLSPVDSAAHAFGIDIPGVPTMGEVADFYGDVARSLRNDPEAPKLADMQRLGQRLAVASGAADLDLAAFDAMNIGTPEARAAWRQLLRDATRIPEYDAAAKALYANGDDAPIDALPFDKLPEDLRREPLQYDALADATRPGGVLAEDPAAEPIRQDLSTGVHRAVLEADVRRLPLASIRKVQQSALPALSDVEASYRRRTALQEATGAPATDRLLRALGAGMVEPVVGDDGAVLAFVPSKGQRLLAWAGAVPEVLWESDIDLSSPYNPAAAVADLFGFADAAKAMRAYHLPTKAGWESWVASGTLDPFLQPMGYRGSLAPLLRPHDGSTNLIGRVAADIAHPDYQGPGVGDALRRQGVAEDSALADLGDVVDVGVDTLAPTEELVLAPVGHAVGAARRAYVGAREASASGLAGLRVGKAALAAAAPVLHGTDALAALGTTVEQGVKDEVRRGRRIFRENKRPGQVDELIDRDVRAKAAQAGIDPDVLVRTVNGLAEEQAARVADEASVMLARRGTPAVQSVRKTAEYARVRAELQAAAGGTKASARDVDVAMALHEVTAQHAVDHGAVPDLDSYFKQVSYRQGGIPAERAYLHGEWPEEGAEALRTTIVRQPEAPAYRAVAQQTETPEFKRWFGDWQADPAAASKVVDVEGEPRVMVHATDTDWAEFDDSRALSSMGLHLGTPEQANAVRLTGGTKADVTAVRPMEGQRSMPLYANIKNPLRMEDKGDWYPWRIVDELAAKGIVDDAPLPENARELAGMDRPHLDRAWQSQSDARKKLDVVGHQAAAALLREEPKATRDAVQHAMRLAERNYVRDLIERHGYDGVVYDNMYEGGGDSYIAFRPEQVKSATANIGTFDPTQLSILRSPTGAPVAPPPVEVLDFPRVVDRHPADAGPWPEQTGPIHWSMGLQEVEHLLSGEGGEHVVLFASDGRQIARAGPTETVAFAPTVDPAKGCVVHPEVIAAARADGNAVFTHNHPSGVVFSTEDLLLAARGNVAEIRAVADGEGEAWILRRPAAGWPTELRMQAAGRAVNRRAFEDANAATDARVRAAGGNPFDREHAKGYDHAAWTTDLNDGYRRNWNAYFGPLGLRLERVPVVDRQGLAATVPAARPAAGVRGRALAPSHLPGGHPVVREPGDAGAVELPHEGQPLFQRLGADVRGSIEPDSVTRRMSEANPAWAAWDARRRELEAADTSVADHAQAVVDAQRRLQSLRDNPAPADPEWHADLDEVTEHLDGLRERPPAQNPELAAHLAAEPPVRREVEQRLAGYTIRLFQAADFGTLVHEQMHLLRFILGDRWTDELAHFFDHAPDPARPGTLRLTRKGEEQFADAATRLMRGRIQPNGRLSAYLDELRDTLSDLWLRLRGLPIEVPATFRVWWDAALNPAAPLRTIAVSHDRVELRPRVVPTSADEVERVEREAVRRARQAEAATTTTATTGTAITSAGLTRAQREADALDVAAKLIADSAVARFRRQWGTTGDIVGLTRRSVVPVARKDVVLRKVDDVFRGILADTTPPVQNGVVTLDASAANRMQLHVAMISDHGTGGETLRRSRNLLSPSKDFRQLSIDEYNTIREATIDAMAGIGSRRDRVAEAAAGNAAVGLLHAAGNTANAIGVLREVGDGIQQRFTVRWKPAQYLSPAAVAVLEDVVRQLGDIPGWFVRTRAAVGNGQAAPALLRDIAHAVPPASVDPADAAELLDLVTKWGPERGALPVMAQTVDDVLNDLGNTAGIFARSRNRGTSTTEAEDAALRYLAGMKGRDLGTLTAAEHAGLVDALGLVHDGLRRRWEAVRLATDEGILKAFGGDPTRKVEVGDASINAFRAEAYRAWYDGEWTAILSGIHDRGMATSPRSGYDPGAAAVAAITRLRGQHLLAQFAEKMADLGMPIRTADIERAGREFEAFVPIGASPQDRAAFRAEVLSYLRAESAGKTSPQVRLAKGSVPVFVGAPTPIHNPDAYRVAVSLLASWGYKAFEDTDWRTLVLPSGEEVFVPEGLHAELQAMFERSAKAGLAWSEQAEGNARGMIGRVYAQAQNVRGALTAGTYKGQGTLAEKVNTLLGHLMDAIGLTYTLSRVNMTTGVILPNPANFLGNLFGGVLQIYEGKGAVGAGRSVGRFLFPTGSGAFLRQAWLQTFNDYAGFPGLQRVLGKRSAVMVADNGLLYTADQVADLIIRHGLSSSMAKAESAIKLIEDIKAHEGSFFRRMQRDGLLSTFVARPFRWWQNVMMEVSTAIDNLYRTAAFVDDLKRGLSPDEAAANARRVGFDYGRLTDFERETLRPIVMFYAYNRRNVDLTWWTMLNHPSRVFGTLRGIRDLQEYFIGNESELLWPDYLDGRIIGWMRKVAADSQLRAASQGVAVVLPPSGPTDAFALFGKIVGALNLEPVASRETLELLTPFAQAPIVLGLGIDIFSGRDLDAYNTVPAWLVELDRQLTGGLLVDDTFDVAWTQARDPASESSPDAARWQANNGKAWWFFRHLLAFPPGGRSLDTLTQMARADWGASLFPGGVVQAGVDEARAYRADGAPLDPLMALAREGVDWLPGVNPPTDRFGKPIAVAWPPTAAVDTDLPRAGISAAEERAGLYALKPVVVPTRAAALDRLQRDRQAALAAEQTRTSGEDPHHYGR